MSGTSGDGVDASIINSNGLDQFEVIKDKYFEYDSKIFNDLIFLKEKFHSIRLKKTNKRIKRFREKNNFISCKNSQRLSRK